MSTTSHRGLLALGSSLLALSVVSVILRFYSRRIQKAPLKVDDWIMIPCLVCPVTSYSPEPAKL